MTEYSKPERKQTQIESIPGVDLFGGLEPRARAVITSSCHIEHRALLDLPDRLVQFFQVRRHLQVLYASIVSDQLHPHVIVPQASLDEVSKQMSVDLNKFACST